MPTETDGGPAFPVCFSVGQVVRIPRPGGGFRVWRVSGVFLGGTRQESVVSLETLDLEPHSVAGHEPGVLLVPEDMLALLAERARREGGEKR